MARSRSFWLDLSRSVRCDSFELILDRSGWFWHVLARSGSLFRALARSGSLWLELARSGSSGSCFYMGVKFVPHSSFPFLIRNGIKNDKHYLS